jgi:hypothetical protein
MRRPLSSYVDGLALSAGSGSAAAIDRSGLGRLTSYGSPAVPSTVDGHKVVPAVIGVDVITLDHVTQDRGGA